MHVSNPVPHSLLPMLPLTVLCCQLQRQFCLSVRHIIVHAQEVLVSGRVCMYVCTYVRLLRVYDLSIRVTLVYELLSTWRSASMAKAVLRWRTWGTEDDNWLGNKLRGTEDDGLFDSEMTDERTTRTEDDLRASSRATRFTISPHSGCGQYVSSVDVFHEAHYAHMYNLVSLYHYLEWRVIWQGIALLCIFPSLQLGKIPIHSRNTPPYCPPVWVIIYMLLQG